MIDLSEWAEKIGCDVLSASWRSATPKDAIAIVRPILKQLEQAVREDAEHRGFIEGMNAVHDSITRMRNARISLVRQPVDYQRLKEAAKANTQRLTGQDAIGQEQVTP